MARFRRNPEQSPGSGTVSPSDRRDVPKEARDPDIGERRDEGSKKSSLLVLDAAKMHSLQKNQYWLTRIVFLRSLGFVYAVAFLVALNQNKYLVGKQGLLPAHHYMERIKALYKGLHSETLLRVPTIMWLYEYVNVDTLLDCIASVGTVLALGITVTGAANAISLFLLWILYHSLVNVGQLWYSFGWESQLLETGFLAIFFCPIWTWKQLPRGTPPSPVVVWGYRWLLFRIMLGAGLIKLRGDRCWWELTCMMYHYEDAYPLLQFGMKHFCPILKKHWSKSAEHSPLSWREKRAQTSRSRRRRRSARKQATESAKEKANKQIAKGTFPPKATYTCACTTCE